MTTSQQPAEAPGAPRGAPIVAIDGPSGTGKSTVARTVAEKLRAGYLDTGALYRIVTVHVLQRGIDPDDFAAVAESLRDLTFESPTDPRKQWHYLAGADITARIRDEDVTAAVSPVAANPAVREFLLDRQRAAAHSGPMVVEGRDIGTVIAPDAAVKIYLTADAAVRAQRRFRQNADAVGGAPGVGHSGPTDLTGSTDVARHAESVESVAASLNQRDHADSSRTHAPLQAAGDAVVVDSTALSFDETVAAILAAAQERHFDTASASDPARAGGAPKVAGTAGVSGTAGASGAPEIAGTAGVPEVSQPVHLRRLGAADDPVPVGRKPRNVDRGRRVGIAVSHTLYRMKVRGEENIPTTGPVVLVANHTTFMDGPVLFGRLPRRISFLVKAEVLVGPLGWLLRTVGQYAIDRAAPQREVLLGALDQLKSGGVIGIFPEGQRTDGSVSQVFNGAGWLATRAGATVVPVAIRGTARTGGRRMPRYRPTVHAVVGKSFDIPRGAGRTAINAATATIQHHLAELVADLDRRIANRDADRARHGRGWRRP